MKASLNLLGVCAFLVLASCAHKESHEGHPVEAKKTKVMKVDVVSADGVLGDVTIEPADGGVKISYMVRNLPKGATLASHIHEKPDCTPPEFKSAGDHFNPTKAKHGAPGSKSHHVGDLGNFEVDKNGVLKAEKVFDFLSLDKTAKNYIGNRSLIIHSKADKFSQPSGDAGGRLACAVLTDWEAQ